MSFEILGEATVPLKKLHADPKNVVIHGDRNMAAITAALTAFKQVGRIAVRKSDGRVFSGNGRYLVMQQLKWKTAKVVWIEGSDDECRAFAVADNRTARLSEFDDGELKELLKELEANDPALLAAAGYTGDELQDLVDGLKKDKPAKKSKTRKGKAAMHVTCPSCGETIAVGGKE